MCQELRLLYFCKKFHFNDKLIIGLLVGELRNMWASFLGNAERHIKILIYKLFKKSDSEYFCRLLYIKISSCLLACWHYGKTFHVSVKGRCLFVDRHLFIQVTHLPSHLLKQQCALTLLFTEILRHTHSHQKVTCKW